jgi:hypothetical protein
VRADAERHPARVFANALVNTAWRNGPVELIHAGRVQGFPLEQRRVTRRKSGCWCASRAKGWPILDRFNDGIRATEALTPRRHPLAPPGGAGRRLGHHHRGDRPAGSVGAVSRAELGAGQRALVDGELLAQGPVLEGELTLGADEEGKEQVEYQGDHEPRSSSDGADRSTICRADDVLAKDDPR